MAARAPFIAAWRVAVTGSPLAPSYYLFTTPLLSLAVRIVTHKRVGTVRYTLNVRASPCVDPGHPPPLPARPHATRASRAGSEASAQARARGLASRSIECFPFSTRGA